MTNHSGRSTQIQALLDKGIDASVIAHISGHANLRSINDYSTLSERRHAELQDLADEAFRDTYTIDVPGPSNFQTIDNATLNEITSQIYPAVNQSQQAGRNTQFQDTAVNQNQQADHNTQFQDTAVNQNQQADRNTQFQDTAVNQIQQADRNTQFQDTAVNQNQQADRNTQFQDTAVNQNQQADTAVNQSEKTEGTNANHRVQEIEQAISRAMSHFMANSTFNGTVTFNININFNK